MSSEDLKISVSWSAPSGKRTVTVPAVLDHGTHVLRFRVPEGAPRDAYVEARLPDLYPRP